LDIWNFLFGKSQKYPFNPAEANEWARVSFPDSQRHIAATIGGILIEQAGVPWSELSAFTTFWELNVWDDFDCADFVDAVEKQFGISIPDHELEHMNRILDLVEYISTHRET
jgi:acyl carrier protein